MDLLNRISSTNAGVQDLRSQIASFRTHNSHQRESLSCELEAHRERKRQEGLPRGDLKSRTKSPEDPKRIAESAKRDEVAWKITHVCHRIAKARSTLGDDRERVKNVQSGGTGDDDCERSGRAHLDEELQKGEGEIKVVEDVIVRAKELEDEAMEGRERLEVVLEQGRQARLSQRPEQDHKLATCQPPDWPTRSESLLASTQPSPTSSVPTSDRLPDSEPCNMPNGHPSLKLMPLSAGVLTSGLPVSDDPIRPNPPANFASFDHPASLVTTDRDTLRSTSLIPTGLINSLPDATPETDLSCSFKADGDSFIIQRNRPIATWRRDGEEDAHESANIAIPRLVDASLFEPIILGNRCSNGPIIGHFDSGFHPQLEESNLDRQSAVLRTTVPHQHSVLDPFSSTPNLVDPLRDLEVNSAHRRWFSVKEKKKLKPGAEAFNLPSTLTFGPSQLVTVRVAAE